MNTLLTLKCDPSKADAITKQLAIALENESWIQLLRPQGNKTIISKEILPNGPGVIIASGGSCGGPHQCLHHASNLDNSAIASGQWLQKQGFDPTNCVIFNPLPLHHVSGLMPWWRSRIWQAKHYWLTPSIMRDPNKLNEYCKPIFQKRIGSFITSLVPTQLQRLIDNQAGLEWLKSFDLIWIGGSKLSEKLANNARRKQICLAPCYGATETAAMITALAPSAFLAGQNGCGNPLLDVDLRLTKRSSLEVKSPRLASFVLKNGSLKKIQDNNGWWQSGDLAKLTMVDCLYQLEIIGRADTAINSGGETIFPEILESKLLAAAKKNQIPIQYILFLPFKDKEWGEKLAGLICWESKLTTSEKNRQLKKIEILLKEWQPAERPCFWQECTALEPTDSGKFERKKWQDWLTINH